MSSNRQPTPARTTGSGAQRILDIRRMRRIRRLLRPLRRGWSAVGGLRIPGRAAAGRRSRKLAADLPAWLRSALLAVDALTPRPARVVLIVGDESGVAATAIAKLLPRASLTVVVSREIDGSVSRRMPGSRSPVTWTSAWSRSTPARDPNSSSSEPPPPRRRRPSPSAGCSRRSRRAVATSSNGFPGILARPVRTPASMTPPSPSLRRRSPTSGPSWPTSELRSSRDGPHRRATTLSVPSSTL